MPKFTVKVTATAEVEETWVVEAPTEDDVRDIVAAGILHEHQFVSDRILGEERDREVESVWPA